MGKKKAKKVSKKPAAKKDKLQVGMTVKCIGVGYVGNAPHAFAGDVGDIAEITKGGDVMVTLGSMGAVAFPPANLKVVK